MAEPEWVREIGKIRLTHLGYEDHGIFSLNVDFDFGGSGQGTGHYAVCSSKSDEPSDAVGIRLVKAIMDACGVSEWGQMVGRTVYVLRDPAEGRSAMIRGIEPLPTENGKRVIFKEVLGDG